MNYICESCGSDLKYYDKVSRMVRTKNRKASIITIKRFKCPVCNCIHRNLPNNIFPYKQYDARIITGVAGQRRSVSFVNEHGLYSILSQSRKEIARAWRRVVHVELINLRRTKGFDISEQFDDWNNAMDNIYFDEATGQLMQSVTTPGGDVEQIPYKG